MLYVSSIIFARRLNNGRTPESTPRWQNSSMMTRLEIVESGDIGLRRVPMKIHVRSEKDRSKVYHNTSQTV